MLCYASLVCDDQARELYHVVYVGILEIDSPAHSIKFEVQKFLNMYHFCLFHQTRAHHNFPLCSIVATTHQEPRVAQLPNLED